MHFYSLVGIFMYSYVLLSKNYGIMYTTTDLVIVTKAISTKEKKHNDRWEFELNHAYKALKTHYLGNYIYQCCGTVPYLGYIWNYPEPLLAGGILPRSERAL